MNTQTTFTRADYMNNRCTHREFYTQIAKRAGIGAFSAQFLAEVRAALAKGDEHLNTIALARWDRMAQLPNPSLVSAFKEAGDSYSLGGAVCAYKTAARLAAAKE